MAELSPAAQAVFWAFNSKFSWIEDGVPGPQFKAIAAALRAAADQVAPEEHSTRRPNDSAWKDGFTTANELIRDELLSIAAELEGK